MWQREPGLHWTMPYRPFSPLAKTQRTVWDGTVDQHRPERALLALAAAWSLPDSAHYQSRDVLRSIERGGLAIRDAQDERGMVLFRKKDHSTWGPIYMPWVYSRWVRTFALVREAMSDEARAEWESALLLGHGLRIAQNELQRIHNIPAHHAMGLYCAGQVFEREAWCVIRRAIFCTSYRCPSRRRLVGRARGPVVAYNLVYVDSLGVYYVSVGRRAGARCHRARLALPRCLRISRRLAIGNHRWPQLLSHRRALGQRRLLTHARRPRFLGPATRTLCRTAASSTPTTPR